MFGSFGMMALVLILLIIFGAGRIPQPGEGLGNAIKGFKESVDEAETLEAHRARTSPPGLQDASTAGSRTPASTGPPPPHDGRLATAGAT